MEIAGRGDIVDARGRARGVLARAAAAPDLRARLLTCLSAALLACLLAALVPPAPAFAALDVEVRFEGVKEDDLKDRLEEASRLTGKDREKPETEAELRHLAEHETGRMEAVLRGQGHYTGRAEYAVSGAGGRYKLTWTITPGPRFRITEYSVAYVDSTAGGAGDGRPQSLGAAGLAPDGSPRGEDIVKLQRDFLGWLHNHGYPQARLAERKVEAAPATGEAALRFIFESGPRAVFGPVHWRGLQRTKEDYAARFVPWGQGDLFESNRLTAFRDSLARTGLFTSVEVEPEETGPEGAAPVAVQVTERPPRTIALGASWSTNLGAGGRISWEHRNFFGRAEKLQAEIAANEVKQRAAVTFRKPRPPERGAWFLGVEGANEDSEAFVGQSITARGGFERKIGKPWTVSAAVEGEWSDLKDTFGERHFTLGAVPVRALYDTTDSLLDPTKGFRLTAQVTPTTGVTGGDTFHFTTFELRGAGHVRLDEEADFLASFWGRAGATVGAPLADMPPNRRFYSGGASSVRGYGYQMLSPLDAEGDPVGGRSVLEGGLEFRAKFTRSIGMAAFVEAGGAADSGLPELSAAGIGAGVGLRYYTGIGPIRLDFAVPLDKRDVDDDFQIYISLGQAF